MVNVISIVPVSGMLFVASQLVVFVKFIYKNEVFGFLKSAFAINEVLS